MIKVLIAEDNLMIADILEEFLVQNDYVVCGIASTVAKSIAFAKWHKPDIVILDQMLAEYGLGTDVAASLGAFPHMGILYVTANVGNVMETATRGHACLTKPYRLDDLLHSIEIVMEMAATGTTATPFPRGLKILPSAVSAANA